MHLKNEETSPLMQWTPIGGGAECSQAFLAPQLEQRKTELSTDFYAKIYLQRKSI